MADQSNEIIAIPALLELLDLANCVTSIDAMGCQTKIARKIVISGGDYVLAVKKNQELLYEVVAELFGDPDEMEEAQCDYHEEVHKGHGRLEIQESHTTNAKPICNTSSRNSDLGRVYKAWS